ncbi:MAG: adenosylcobinamide-phosphate synthase CbiB [Gemmatimonadota bacterium]
MGLMDAVLGEPPLEFHPVRWMGSFLSLAERWNGNRALKGWKGRTAGAGWVLAGTLLATWVGSTLGRRTGQRNGVLSSLLSAAVVKPSFALRGLRTAGARVRRALEAGDLAGARRHLGRDLVSRPTEDLSATEGAGAAIESLAENLSDSVVAPLMYTVAGGSGAAYAYRFANTADAMLGYRTPALADFGWCAARLDDVLNAAPARLTAAVVALLAPTVGGYANEALAVALTDGRATPSPNAGWPMGAMAGGLGVRLTKRGAYTLNRGGRDPASDDLKRAEVLISRAGALSVVVAAALAEAR